MKKLIVAFFIVLSFNALGQNYALSIKTGYSFPVLRQMQGTGDANNLIYVSFAKGWPIDLQFEKRLNENIWMDISLTYLHGSKQITDKLLGTTEYFSEQFRSILSFKFVQSYDKMSLYSEVGAIIPFLTQFYRTIKREDKSYYALIKGYQSIGFNGILGFNYYLRSNLYLSVEAQALAQRIRIKDLYLDNNVIHYERDQTYELPFSSVNMMVSLRYLW